MKNLELFDRLALRFTGRVLFVKDIGAENAEVCQWTFFGLGQKKAEVCCTSIVYATDKKQTKVEFPEARILEEAMNVLLFEEKPVCGRCGGEGCCVPTASAQPISPLHLTPAISPAPASSRISPVLPPTTTYECNEERRFGRGSTRLDRLSAAARSVDERNND